MIEPNSIINADCLDIFPQIKDKSVELVLTDMPYGITACAWDIVPDLDKLWTELKRIGKPNCAYVFTASQPFTTDLICSNRKWFKYEWIWEKNHGSNFASIKYQPMKLHENVLVFGESINYFPIMQKKSLSSIQRDNYIRNGNTEINHLGNLKTLTREANFYTELKYPSSIQYFNNNNDEEFGLHPTQKPIALFQYLIQTYTNEGDLVLDPFGGASQLSLLVYRQIDAT
ncbi:site-specific DNA-methyltransferase [bacterium]|nr:site-specific DNA-methyltransferase [bacterium]